MFFNNEIHKYKIATRTKGRSLLETGYSLNKIIIYRACTSNMFHPLDYVTLSRKFAIEHANHNVIVNEEEQIVIKTMVNASDVYEAYNPGEYFYDGPEIKGTIIYTAKI